ncbi:Pyridoxine 5'-phosphate synthase [hydrothermal vent metagenome]|uniref:Pyridoxine 5'-phosphate synthase n=1 Tax=hydrothermal vent metagenome TaxID=652676 RepID=A0A3B1E5B3_9ZZZZ
MKLGVNIDHIAVLREARETNDPNPLDALHICKIAGANQITIHLREDRRHIKDEDAKNIILLSTLPVNLECSINDEIIQIASNLKPSRVTLVPENRLEVTTEGGLNLETNFEQISKVINKLQNEEIEVSLFIDAKQDMIELSKKLKAQWIELHTGKFSNIYGMLYSGLNRTHHSIKELELSRNILNKKLNKSIEQLQEVSILAFESGLKVSAGHGLNYQNVSLISNIKQIEELNIGQSIIARSVFTGLENAILDMRRILDK